MFRDTALDALVGEPARVAEAQRAIGEELARREIRFGDGLLPTYTVPFFVEAERLAEWVATSERLAAAIERVAREVRNDPRLYARLGLRPDAMALIDIDPGYEFITVLSRPDAVIVDGRPRFIEFNCDSPAMMSFSDVLGEIFTGLPLWQHLGDRITAEKMTPRLLEVLLECWRQFGGAPRVPTIAITDWQGQKTRFEHRQLQRDFEAAGVPTIICDPRAFTRNGRALEVEGRPVHLVYRRALFGELLDRQSEVQALLGAYRDGAICMVNSMRSYLASSKTLLALLCDDAARFGSDAAEVAASLARTRLVSPEMVKTLRTGPRQGVLKRGESHGGMHVLLPELADEAAWQTALDDAEQAPWILQEALAVPTLPVLRVDGQSGAQAVRREEKFYNWNPFLFGGRYAGGIARASDTRLINISLGGGLLPTIPVRGTVK